MEKIILPHQQKVSIWQILFYLSMATLTIWLILKVVGVIQSPAWLEFGIPGAGLVIGALSLYQNLTETIRLLSVSFATLTPKFDHLEQDMHVVKHDVNTLKQDMMLVKRKLKL